MFSNPNQPPSDPVLNALAGMEANVVLARQQYNFLKFDFLKLQARYRLSILLNVILAIIVFLLLSFGKNSIKTIANSSPVNQDQLSEITSEENPTPKNTFQISEVKIVFRGRVLAFDDFIVLIVNSKGDTLTYVPIRAFARELDFETEWSKIGPTITVTEK